MSVIAPLHKHPFSVSDLLDRTIGESGNIRSEHDLFDSAGAARQPLGLSDRRRATLFFALVALGIALLVMISTLLTHRASSEIQALPTASASLPGEAAQLGVRGVSLERHDGFLIASGEAFNRTEKPLRNAEAVLELFDAQGKLLKVESGLLELTTLRSGEESPFRLETADVSGVASYRLRFRHLMGAALPARDL